MSSNSIWNVVRTLRANGIKSQDIKEELEARSLAESGIGVEPVGQGFDSLDTSILCKYSTQTLNSVLPIVCNIEHDVTQIDEREEF